MALQIWMPLNGNIDNQGLSNIDTVNLNATSSTAGKIGSCYYFNGSSARIYANNVDLPNSEMSCCCWAKFESLDNSNYPYLISLGEGGTGVTQQIGLFIYKADKKVAVCGNGTELKTSYVVTTNVWYHFCITYTGTVSKLYINGSEVYSGASAGAPTKRSGFCIGARASSASGAGAGITYPMKGWMNDVRVYDHALSPREIKEISKGLVLHYPLNREGFGGDNLLVNTDFSGVSKKFTLNSGSEGGLWFPPTSWDRNTEYTVSCKLRGNANMNLYLISSGGNQALNWVNRENLSPTDYKFFSITFTSRNDRDVSNLFICTRYGTSNSSVGDWFEIAPNSLKFEKGATATPWIPNYTDDLYSTMGLDENIVHDASGFQHNGELVVIGKNLIDKNNVTSGGHINNTGGITNTSGWNYTNYIKVKPSTSYIASSISSGGSGTYFALYDENKTLTRTVLITANQNPTFTTTATERYVRFSIRSLSNELDTAKLEGGTTVTAYGSEGSIEWETNSPRYTLACNPHSANSTQNARPGTTYIRGDCALTNPNQLTIAFWCYTRSGYRGETGQGAFCTSMATINSDGIGVDYQTTAMNHRDNSIDVNSSDGNSHIRPVIGFIANVWHHYAFTYDGQNARTYRDGVLQDTKSFSTATALGSFNMIVLGLSRAGGVWRRNDNTYSDFRVYSTALSVDDILELYHTPITLSSNGTLLTQGEYVEV